MRGIFLILLGEDTSYKYYLIDNDFEIDNFETHDFDFFHIYGITNYKETFKIWTRKFPRPTLIIGAKESRIISFIYIDAWEEIPDIVNVLRAQETVKNLRGKKIGYKNFLLGAFFAPGYIITKPLTSLSKKFYEDHGFEDIKNVNRFKKYHSLTGYLVLPLIKKSEHLMKIEEYFTSLYL